MIRRIVSGPFAVRSVGPGAWRLTTGAAPDLQIYLRVPDPDASVLRDSIIATLELTWRHDGVSVSLTGEKNVRHLKAQTAILHETRDRLYDDLPLAGFDAGARRFWKRVFRLMRVPGGRFLLRFIARRKPGRDSREKALDSGN